MGLGVVEIVTFNNLFIGGNEGILNPLHGVLMGWNLRVVEILLKLGFLR